MRILFSITFCFLIAAFGNSQNSNCSEKLLSIKDQYNSKQYTNAISTALQLESSCLEFSKTHYDFLVLSLKNEISNQKEADKKIRLIDTLVAVFARSEKKGFYDKNNDLSRAAYILKSTHPDNYTADLLMQRVLDNPILGSPADAGEIILTLYYFNLHTLFLASRPELKSDLKLRLINENYRLLSWMNSYNMSEKSKVIIKQYFKNTIKNCDDLVPETPFYLDNLPKETAARKTVLTNLKTTFEAVNCQKTVAYNAILDSLILLNPDAEYFIQKAAHFSQLSNFEEEQLNLDLALKNSNQKILIDSINYLKARSYYNAKDFSKAFEILEKQQESLSADGFVLAAICVGESAKNCGESLLQQKLNFYFAIELLESAQSKGRYIAEDLINFQLKLPSKEELKNAGLKSGDKLILSCWNKQITLP